MRKLILFFIAINFLNYSLVAQKIEWGKTFGGDTLGGNFLNFGRSIDVDADGNVYTTGSFEGTGDFDPGPGIYNLTSNNEFDIFISKLNKNGDFLWAKSIGGISSTVANPKADTGYGIVTDMDGNVYVCGAFENTVDFDPGLSIYNQSSSGGTDIFILKLDTDGNFIWAKTIGGIAGDFATSIAIDNGYLYTTGYFSGTVDFDPGPGIYNLNTGGTFILKMDDTGNFLWAKCLEGPIEPKSITIDNNGNILTTGYFTRTVDFDPGLSVFNISSVLNGGFSSYDIFISKLDSNGNFLWAKSIGGTVEDNGNYITTDKFNNIYITGYFGNIADFDPGPGIFNLDASSFRYEIFILKLNSNGEFIWARNMGGKESDVGRSIGVDIYGNVYSTGWYREEGDFDPGPGIYNLNGGTISYLQANLFISKLDINGDFVWAISSKNSDMRGVDSEGNSIHIDKYQNIYLTGDFSGTQYIEFGQETFNLDVHKGGGRDVFILKLSQCPTSYDTMLVQTCDSYNWIDGKTYTESTDTAEYILTNAQGCDSIVLLDLTIYKKDSTSMQTTACIEYIWKEDTLKNTGIYRYDTLNIYGCDSTVTLDLTINKSSDSSIVIASCDSYIWHDSSYTQSGVYRFDTINAVGCDSTVTLDLTLNSSASTTLEKSACESYTWHDSIYTASGTYRFDTLNTTGCDSIVTLNLTIVDKIEKLDTMYICQGDTIEIFDSEIWENKLVSKTFTSQKGCDSIQNIQVVVNPLPEGIITESICEGDSIFVVNNWFSKEGTYIIHKENTGECDSLYTVDITIRSLKYTYDTINICQGDTIEVFGFEISTETDVEQSYVGSNDCDSTVYMHIGVLPVSSSQSQITLCPGDSILIAGDWIKTSGEYQEHLTGINGCDSISNIQISVLQEPEMPVINIDCENARIIASFGAITSGWNILWSNSNTTKSTFYTTEQQAYAVLTTSSGCELRYDFNIPQIPDLSTLPEFRDTTVKTEEKIEVSIELDTSQWQINWSPADIIDCLYCQSIIISPTQDVQITATFTHISGCVYTRNFNITIDNTINWDIPNIFTPDGDGINDTWTFPVPKDINIVSCSIFDLWGEKIYHSGNNNQINWDGTFKGSSVLSGVYIYIIEYLDSNGKKKVIAGDVTVVR